MARIKVFVSGVSRDIHSKGKDHTFSEVWVYLPGAPFPQATDHYGKTNLSPGEYEAELQISVNNNRLQARVDLKNAKPLPASGKDVG